MNYKLRLEKIKTIKELFDFREELLESAERYSHLWNVEETPSKSDNLKKCQDANFYLQRVNAQIEHFERYGLVLSSIMKPEQEVKEKLFTENEISSLQSAIHKITGDGEVMELFNKLLGTNSSK